MMEALVFTALTFVVYLLIAKSKEAYYGILMAMFGIRMLPIDIFNLGDFSKITNLAYFLVDRVSVIVFLLIIIMLYRSQKKPAEIKAIPIIAIITIVPFFNEIQSTVFEYLVSISNGNLMMAFMSEYIVYSVAMIALLFVATRSNKTGIRMICDFQLLALTLNIGKRTVAVAINLFKNQHISGSYYGWILVYIVFFLMFYFFRKTALKQEN